jgi:tRNA threonylcarbamoyladenosine biosynthesis protein TsaE
MTNMQNQFTLYAINDLSEAVKWVLEKAQGRHKIMLYGNMGAGKTTFTKAFCLHFGVKDSTSSPTFSLVNEYSYEEKGVKKMIHHLDLYRLKSIDEALDIGIEDYLYDSHYCLIEWAQIIEPILPEDVLKIGFEISENFERKIVVL